MNLVRDFQGTGTCVTKKIHKTSDCCSYHGTKFHAATDTNVLVY